VIETVVTVALPGAYPCQLSVGGKTLPVVVP
jgi:hypothetical protein